MSRIAFTPKLDVGQYLDCALNTDLYQALTSDQRWHDLFEPLVFFNLLYSQYNAVQNQALNPLDFKKSLLSMGLTDAQCFFLLDALLQLIGQENMLSANQVTNSMRYEPLDAFTKRWIVDGLRMSINSLAKLQQHYALFVLLNDEHTRLAEKLQIGLTHDTEAGIDDQVESSTKLKLSDKHGAKTDFLRIVHALFDLNIIEDMNGHRLSKEDFCKRIGAAFGADYPTPFQSIAQSLKPTEEVHLAVFDKLKGIARKQWQDHTKGNN